MEILLVEDDTAIGRSLQRGIEENGHHCVWERTGPRGLEVALKRQPDLIVLDVMLPEMDGFEIVRELRAKGCKMPVIMLTARHSVEDRVQGLRAGADDYVVKPFSLVELLARIDAVARRSLDKPTDENVVGALRLEPSTRRITIHGKTIELTPTEFSLFEFLSRYAGQVVTRKMLCEHLWEADWEGTTNVIEVHVNRIRNKLEKAYGDTLIETVRGRGYVLRQIV